jgi:hypothetical protein
LSINFRPRAAVRGVVARAEAVFMDPGVLSAISALAGTSIGALTSLASTWMTTKSQARAAQVAAERTRREELYGRYLDELAVLYSNAINKTGVDHDRLTVAYALSGRIALYASPPVSTAAMEALKFIVDIALGPPLTQEEMRGMMNDAKLNVLATFARTCREELLAIR